MINELKGKDKQAKDQNRLYSKQILWSIISPEENNQGLRLLAWKPEEIYETTTFSWVWSGMSSHAQTC